jgi:hypothetical protein
MYFVSQSQLEATLKQLLKDWYSNKQLYDSN